MGHNVSYSFIDISICLIVKLNHFRYLALAWDVNNVRTQDYWTVLGYIADNPVGRPLVWDYYRANWEKFVERSVVDSSAFINRSLVS